MSGVEVRAVSKRYGAASVLDAVDARFPEGRFTSLLGPSGSGKTTLLRIIGGFVAPDGGRVVIGGADVTAVPLWKRRIGMVFQSYALFPHMTVAQNVAYGLNRRGIRGAAARAEVGRALELVHLTGFDARRPKQLSGGQQQRVALARAIVTKPRVLLLDEPLSALDRRLRQNMQIELKRIQRESGLTTIFVTHDQEEALTLSDTVAILDRGRIVQEGAPADIYEHPRTSFAAAFLGDANFFRGTVRGEAIDTPAGPIRIAGALPAPGTAVTVAVRPEKMTLLSAGPDPAGNVIDATLREIIYAGAVSTFLLTGSDGAEIKVLSQNRDLAGPAPGARVRLAWAPAHTVLLAD
ncbi:ABC transporter ATP-binding protein [Lichenifustis flavocetrariae]|uniref:ABC transporter ATP-binding protein n=1 Tax=Lichenifustis flavocetrariae TaxID=2949735 RepID=A0AA41YZH5_9HYPH|nr:ABC transporter ATP-binding protein [Lichenifustis flavocetrariae]MCW6509958.1 ABC transporter ATP-binding protein [Lichenifustis flavocetrariae]